MGNIQNSVPYIVGFIVCLQLVLFVMNLLRMRVFRRIFSNDDSWEIVKDNTSGFVSGIKGKGNNVFDSIRESINKYLKNNAGSVIDFHLLKDAVDRHCESVEDEISTQTPVPLYCGLAGTMIGVILGLGSLLYTDSINALIGGSGTGAVSPEAAEVLMGEAANGINELLKGVAWAMVASICGILFTTINSLLFKGCKLKAERGKNDFLAWMQSKLLPELPDNTSSALTTLVNNLNEFNNTFYHNTRELRDALKGVNKSYAIQAEIIRQIHEMDVMKMAKANVKVLEELKECTDKLEQFNLYLNSIKGYTDTIHRFNEQFNQEANRLHILEEIRDFFNRNKAEIAISVTDQDNYLRTALDSLQKTSTQAIQDLGVALTDQTDRFKTLNDQMCNEFTRKLNQWPQLESQLEKVTTIPSQLEGIANRMVASNQAAVDRMREIGKVLSKRNNGDNMPSTVVPNVSLMPRWMRWLLVLCMITITSVAVFIGKKVYNDMEKDDVQQLQQVEIVTEEISDDETSPGILQDSSMMEVRGNEETSIQEQ